MNESGFYRSKEVSPPQQAEDAKDDIPAKSDQNVTHAPDNDSKHPTLISEMLKRNFSPVFKPIQLRLNNDSCDRLQRLFNKSKPFDYHDLEMLVKSITTWGKGGEIREKKGGGSHLQLKLPNLNKPEGGMEVGYSDVVKGGVAKKKGNMSPLNKSLVKDAFARAGVTPDRFKKLSYEEPKTMDLGGGMSVKYV